MPDHNCQFCKFRWKWITLNDKGFRDLRPDGYKCTIKEDSGEEDQYCKESDYSKCTICLSNQPDKKVDV